LRAKDLRKPGLARTGRDEDRLLAQDQREAVARTPVPLVKELADGALRELMRRLRERRGRARALANRQRRALRRKRAAAAPASPPPLRTPGEGMRAVPNEPMAPSGAIGVKGDRPVLERSRKVRCGAQAGSGSFVRSARTVLAWTTSPPLTSASWLRSIEAGS
jgi:hypothetical protein